jgi:hypothetical protein
MAGFKVITEAFKMGKLSFKEPYIAKAQADPLRIQGKRS